jgi:uncharacterized protein YjiS (DUF1127 family)
MRYFADNGSALLAGRPTSAQTLATAAKRTWDVVTGPVRAYLQREAVYRELTELDDRMLSDIGLNRVDVYAVANGLRSASGHGKIEPKL